MSTSTMTTLCPECEVPVSPDEAARLGEVVECTGCAAELEIVSIRPMTLALAPEVEEDWGE